jgi:hypothetical protein
VVDWSYAARAKQAERMTADELPPLAFEELPGTFLAFKREDDPDFVLMYEAFRARRRVLGV